MKLNWSWPAAMIFTAVFVTLGALVFVGKVHLEVLMAVLAWLIPSPIGPKPLNDETTLP